HLFGALEHAARGRVPVVQALAHTRLLHTLSGEQQRDRASEIYAQVMTSGPLQKGRAPGEPRAETCQQNVVAGLDPAVADGFLERQGYRRARRIAVFVDVDRDPLDRQADAPRGGVDDAEVGLVGDPE